MTKDEIWVHIQQTLDKMMGQSDKLRALTRELYLPPDSPLVEPFGILEGAVISNLEALAGDADENINWYVYECDYGRKPMDAGCENEMRPIDSIANLRWLIELDCNP